jgi:hypothetical protein
MNFFSPGPDGPSPVGRCRPSNSFSPSSAQETRNADVMLTLAALLINSENLFFPWVNFQKFLINGFDL